MPWVRVPDEGSIVYQLKVTIKNLNPPIWRRVLVPNLFTLGDLHYAIQAIFAWDNSHLFIFRTPAGDFPPMEFDARAGKKGQEADPFEMPLHRVLADKRTMEYEYDFGDSWVHSIKLEKRLKPEPGVKYPLVAAGEFAAPPEDCGGVWGYANMLEVFERGAVNDDEVEMIGWLGKKFDPAKFDVAKCNKRLAKYVRGQVLARKRKEQSAKLP